jgi:hypothetical protein
MSEKYIELFKWFISSVVIVSVTLIVDTGFKDRETGIEEIKVYNQYVDIILNAEDIEQRWRLVEYFATVTPTERLRERWMEYQKVIKPDYIKYHELENLESRMINQSNIPMDSIIIIHDKKVQINGTLKSNKKYDLALDYENMGFECLLNKDIMCAIDNFKLSEQSYNGFHQVYEIYVYLLRNKSNPQWDIIYNDILTRYSWKMSPEVKNRFKNQ